MAILGRPKGSRRVSADFRIYDDFRALPKAERSIVLRHLQYFAQDDETKAVYTGELTQSLVAGEKLDDGPMGTDV